MHQSCDYELGFYRLDYRLCPPEIQREEKTVQKAIKDAAKRNDMQSAKVMKFLPIYLFWPIFTLHLTI